MSASIASTDASHAPAARKVSFGTKLSFGFGAVAYGVKDNGFATLLLLFYNQVMGLDARLVSLAIGMALICDAFIDPMVGHLSDHTRTGWGRRHPWIYGSAIPIALAYVLLWNPPDLPQEQMLWFLFGTALLVRGTLSCYEVPAVALTPELTGDYDERTRVISYRYFFGWIGGLGMMFVAFAFFLVPSLPEYPDGQLNRDGYHLYGIAAAIVMLVAILVSAIGTHRQIPFLVKPPRMSQTIGSTFRGIFGTLRNPAFGVIIGAGIFSYANQGLNFALFVYLYPHFWGFSEGEMLLFFVALALAAAFAFAVAPQLGQRMGKKQAALGCVAAYLILMPLPYWLALGGVFPPVGSALLHPLLLAIVAFATGFGICVMILMGSMIADIVEESQSRTGKRSEGLFYAGHFFMQKCVGGLGLAIAGLIIWAVGFPDQAVRGEVPQPTVDALAASFAGITMIFGVVSLAILSRYPISRKDHDARLAMLAASGQRSPQETPGP